MTRQPAGARLVGETTEPAELVCGHFDANMWRGDDGMRQRESGGARVVAEMIGREGEAGAVARFIERVPYGPVALAIEGEPGIGKTTLWLEAVRAGEERGYRVLQARPAEAEADLSYAALGDLVGSAFDEVSGELPAPQQHALEVALLRREAMTPADPRTTASALLSVLSALGAERPLVVAVDDAQWLDPASERALAFVCRRLPSRLGLLVARRSEAADEAPLGLDRALDREALELLVLGPLSLAALHHVIQRELGIRLARPALVRIEAVSGGNPFFALEIARALNRDGGERRLGDPLPVPQSLQELVGARVRRLSDSAQAAALAVAALSRPTAASVAAALAEPGDAAAALLEAEEAGVLVWEREWIRFSHPLLASAVYGSASTARRRQLHERLADVASDPEERARHLAHSITDADEGAAEEIEHAAALAERRGAPEAAAELYEASCRLTPDGRPEDLARRILGAAGALAMAGDLDGARSLANTALETAREGSLRARVLLLLASLASYTETIEARIGYHERALAEAGDDQALRAEILLSLVEEISVDPQRAIRRAEEAIELVRELGRSLAARPGADEQVHRWGRSRARSASRAARGSSRARGRLGGPEARVPAGLVPLGRRPRRDADAVPPARGALSRTRRRRRGGRDRRVLGDGGIPRRELGSG